MQPEGSVDEARLEARRWLATAEEDQLGATAAVASARAILAAARCDVAVA